MIWQQYRRTAPYIQITILVVIVALALRGAPLVLLVLVALVMEIAAVLGAAWAVRLKRKAGDPTLLRPRSSKF